MDVRSGVIIILLLFVLLYRSALKTQEAFGGLTITNPDLRQSGSSLFLSNPSLFCTLQNTAESAMTDSKEMLLFRTCVGIKDPKRTFEKEMSQYIATLGYLVSKQSMRTNHFNDVISRIHEVLESVRLSNGSDHRLVGPIYVLMFQAPYFRDLRKNTTGMNSVISIQPFNANEYRYSPSLILRDIVENEPLGSMAPEKGVAFVFYIMFPMYDPANKMRTLTPEAAQNAVEECTGYWLKQATNENMCKMKCPNHDGYTCGCLNTNKPYVSVCLGPRDKKDLQKKEFINYGSLYRINERHAKTNIMFDASAFHKDGCSVVKA